MEQQPPNRANTLRGMPDYDNVIACMTPASRFISELVDIDTTKKNSEQIIQLPVQEPETPAA